MSVKQSKQEEHLNISVQKANPRDAQSTLDEMMIRNKF